MSGNTLNASVHYGGDQFFIRIAPTDHGQIVDTKSDRKAASIPVDLSMIALATCTPADVASILRKKRQTVTSYPIDVTGRTSARFLTFHVNHIVQGRSVSEKAVADAVFLSQSKYWPIAATVRRCGGKTRVKKGAIGLIQPIFC